jgi:hypothetical protein
VRPSVRRTFVIGLVAAAVIAGAVTASATTPDGAIPFVAGETWEGHYVCTQGLTNLRLQVVRVEGARVSVIFDFHHSPTGAAGRYWMSGTYDRATRRIRFVAGAWIDQPQGYVTVGLDGAVSADRATYSGQIVSESSGCTWFDVRRRPSGP